MSISARESERRAAARAADVQRALIAAQPADATARHNLAFHLRALGEPRAALAALAPIGAGLRAETRLLHAHLLHDTGDYDGAIAAYRAIVAVDPANVDAHATLARLLPQVGRASGALESYRAALTKAPQTGMLWVSAMQAAHDLHDAPQLLDWAVEAQRRFGRDTMTTVFAGMALTALGEDARAIALLDTAVRHEPDYAPARTSLAFVQIRQGALIAAEAHALHAARLQPEDQVAWSLLSVIWRLKGDAREGWLADYDRLVMTIDVDADVAAIADALEALHDTGTQPADQSLRGGTQTRGDLHRRAEPELQSLADGIERGVAARLAALPEDAAHPFLRRNRGAMTWAGSWSVRLQRQGFHVSHIHPAGWLSSALHVRLPAMDTERGEGALVFGVPDAALGLDLAPRRSIAPVAGRLVIFPSYFWHGTRPFAAEQPRLTMAFDALPAAK